MLMIPSKLSSTMIESLKHYVYIYIDPSDNKIFYVGKGSGNRALKLDNRNAECQKILNKIKENGSEPIIEILVHGLQDDIAAKKIEAATIDLIGIKNLCNQVRGWESVEFGRMNLEELIAIYEKEKAIIDDPVILIRINQHYHYGMSDDELYDATRGIWKIGEDRDNAIYALAVYGGIVHEIYKIREWLPAGTTQYKTRPEINYYADKERWEFVGEIAEETIREKYLLKSVEEYFPNHAQNPIRYVRC
jgi:uncharacterized protein